MNNSIVDRVLHIVLSSTRAMPAHYSSLGDRTQSFCVDFDMDRDDEYNMASFAFYKGSEALTTCVNNKPSDLESSVIIKIGEDIVVGTYILKKLEGHSELSSLIQALVNTNMELVPVRQAVIDAQEIQDYFTACQSYGLSKASALSH